MVSPAVGGSSHLTPISLSRQSPSSTTRDPISQESLDFIRKTPEINHQLQRCYQAFLVGRCSVSVLAKRIFFPSLSSISVFVDLMTWKQSLLHPMQSSIQSRLQMHPDAPLMGALISLTVENSLHVSWLQFHLWNRIASFWNSIGFLIYCLASVIWFLLWFS